MIARHKAGGNDILYHMIVRCYRARIAVSIQLGNFLSQWGLAWPDSGNAVQHR